VCLNVVQYALFYTVRTKLHFKINLPKTFGTARESTSNPLSVGYLFI